MARSVPPQLADLEGPKLNLGCGENCPPDFVNLDVDGAGGATVIFDLEYCADFPLPFPSDHFAAVWACHTLEHVANIFPLMSELWHVLKPGGTLFVECPRPDCTAAYFVGHKRRLWPDSFQSLFPDRWGNLDTWPLRTTRRLGYFGGPWRFGGELPDPPKGCWQALYYPIKDQEVLRLFEPYLHRPQPKEEPPCA